MYRTLCTWSYDDSVIGSIYNHLNLRLVYQSISWIFTMFSIFLVMFFTLWNSIQFMQFNSILQLFRFRRNIANKITFKSYQFFDALLKIVFWTIIFIIRIHFPPISNL